MKLEDVAQLKQELTDLPYKDFQAKFTELGIAEIFKGGVKKEGYC
jgi:hypothetical protein